MAGAHEQAETWRASYGQVVARAWSDVAFKAKLLADPAAALAKVGVEVPAGVTVTVVENTPESVHLVLPSPPPEDEPTNEELDRVALFGQIQSLTTCCWSSPRSHSS